MLKQPVPTSLVIVAALFILGGLSAVVEMIAALARGGIFLNFGVLGLFIGFGLLRLSRGWRTCGLVFTWLGLIFMPIAGLLVLTSSGPVNFTMFGQSMGRLPPIVGLLFVALIFAVLVWQYRVLTRPDIRFLFKLPGALPPPRSQGFDVLPTAPATPYSDHEGGRA